MPHSTKKRNARRAQIAGWLTSASVCMPVVTALLWPGTGEAQITTHTALNSSYVVPAGVTANGGNSVAMLGARAVFTESELFEPGQPTLSSASQALVRQLAGQLGPERMGAVSITTGHGMGASQTATLWLGRAAAIRKTIQSLDPREISIAAAAPADPGTFKVLQLAVLAR